MNGHELAGEQRPELFRDLIEPCDPSVDGVPLAIRRELEALTWDDVDLEHGVIHITKAVDRRTSKVKSTKPGESRRIPIEEKVTAFSTTEGYIREAENLTGHFGEPFPPLPFELTKGFGLVSAFWSEKPSNSREKQWSKGGSNTTSADHEASRDDSPSTVNSPAESIAPVSADAASLTKSIPPEPVLDPIESALAEALRGASGAGEWGTVARLAEELQARRLARTNVAVLETGKPRSGRSPK